MKTPLVLVAVLLAGTAAGAAIAATPNVVRLIGHDEFSHAARPDAGETRLRVADDHRRDRDRDHHKGRSHHDDDEDDDDGARGDGRGGRMPAAGPTDPTTPVPDNGLFQGKARPKVEVN